MYSRRRNSLWLWLAAAATLLPSRAARAQEQPALPTMMPMSGAPLEPQTSGEFAPALPGRADYPPAPNTLAGPPGALAGPPGMVAGPPGGQAYTGLQEPFNWQLLPDGLIYRSYLAGMRESRIGGQWVYVRGQGWLWDSTLGGRVPLVRYGNDDKILPEGYELDFEGAAFPRLQLQDSRQLEAVDFRFGLPLTMRSGPWEFKFAYDHVCAHLGDQYLLTHPGVSRINFQRDGLVLGAGFRPVPDIRVYAEVGWAFYTWGATEPWEFQFGFEYSQVQPTGPHGSPFFAINGHLRQEVDFGGAMTVEAGWQWRGNTGHLFRIGAEYFDGKSEQYQFSDLYERQIGAGVWYDY